MKYQIDPTVDFVFKLMLGSEARKSLTLHFLNAFLQGTDFLPLVDVTLMNPYNVKDIIDEKETIVDVLAKDSSGRLFQIEMQSVAFRALPERMLFTWAQLYSKQSVQGKDYKDLCSAAAIWILNDRLPVSNEAGSRDKRKQGTSAGTPLDEDYYHRFVVYDPERKVQLSTHLTLITVELPKAKRLERMSDRDRWTRFFREATALDDEKLPEYMETREMRQAMDVLKEIAQSEENLHYYHARLDFLRTQASIAGELRDLKEELQQSKTLRVRAEAHAAKVQVDWLLSEQAKQRALEREQQALAQKQQAEAEKQQALEREQQALEREQRAEAERAQAIQQVRALEALMKQLKSQELT